MTRSGPTAATALTAAPPPGAAGPAGPSTPTGPDGPVGAGGLARGLAAVLAGTDLAAAATGGWIAVPTGELHRTGQDLERRPHHLAEREQIALVRAADPAARSGAPAPRLPAEDLLRLAAVRAEYLRELLERAVRHLDGRTYGGTRLSALPVVRAELADLDSALTELSATLEQADDPAAVARWAGAELDALGWRTAVLFGGAGYLADHEARGVYVCELIWNTWGTEPSA
ncbi:MULTISPECIES: hypothetical protein [Kitasatospora]|nr:MULTISPECIES: hypothetical protein [Kitasatospora]